jgi:hypothetical protein
MTTASTAAILTRSHDLPSQIGGASFLNLVIVDNDRTIR